MNLDASYDSGTIVCLVGDEVFASLVIDGIVDCVMRGPRSISYHDGQYDDYGVFLGDFLLESVHEHPVIRYTPRIYDLQ